ANTAHLAIEGFTRLLQSSQETDAGQAESVTASRLQMMQKIDALSEVDRLGLAWAVARNSFKRHTRKLLVDISVLAQHDAKTGI
ncbi:glycosyltransferase family 1 protein, partial [Escherichia coli]|nr:glycosyltransferase family 1 protein [Escherichia coli]